MLLFLLLVFVIIPIVELYVIVQVASAIGVIPALALLLLFSVLGAWLVKMAGIGVLARMQRTVRAGRVPAAEMVDGAFILGAGVLLVVPGFVTDAVGLVLLLPPVRALARRILLRRYEGIIDAGGTVHDVRRGRRRVRVVDVDVADPNVRRDQAPPSSPPELGR